MRIRTMTVIAGLAIFWPACAFADVGTPLVWAEAFHLALGNALVGLLEGWLLARVFKLSRTRCSLVMIAANYFSATVGYWWLNAPFDRPGIDIHNGLAVTWRLVGLSYLLTLLLEWPFVAFCFRGHSGWLKCSMKGSLLVQTTSYALLFSGFFLLSGKSLYTDMTLVSPSEIVPPHGVIVYYISDVDGQVYAFDLGSDNDSRVAAISTPKDWEALELFDSAYSNAWDLAVGCRGEFLQVAVSNISTYANISEKTAFWTSQYHGWGQALQVGLATNSNWHFSWAHWAALGVYGGNGSQHFRLAFETPFGGWSPYRVIHLPEEKLIVQLGIRQICLVDPITRKIALLRKGHGPIAMLKGQLNRNTEQP